MISFKLNGRSTTIDADPDTPLLWVLRDHLNLTGTKFGCGIAVCGACTVHMNGTSIRSCVVPVSSCEGQEIVTIEGLVNEQRLHRVQQAWIDHQVPQCGYCQSGMIMAAADLLNRSPDPTDEEIAASITNICRCGTYPRVRNAIRDLASRSAEKQIKGQS